LFLIKTWEGVGGKFPQSEKEGSGAGVECSGVKVKVSLSNGAAASLSDRECFTHLHTDRAEVFAFRSR
jgi:hypothetical protein